VETYHVILRSLKDGLGKDSDDAKQIGSITKKFQQEAFHLAIAMMANVKPIHRGNGDGLELDELPSVDGGLWPHGSNAPGHLVYFAGDLDAHLLGYAILYMALIEYGTYTIAQNKRGRETITLGIVQGFVGNLHRFH
jgi:hypothetical protein